MLLGCLVRTPCEGEVEVRGRGGRPMCEGVVEGLLNEMMGKVMLLDV